VTFAIGFAYWLLISYLFQTNEPWDHKSYAVAYPSSLLLAGATGLLFKSRAWIAGAVITFVQILVMLVKSPPSSLDPLLLIGLLMLLILSLPAMVVSELSSRLWRRYSSK
jgi:hypothetical protein